MSDETDRVIALAIGWKECEPQEIKYMWRVGAFTTGEATWIRPDGSLALEEWIPDFHTCANAALKICDWMRGKGYVFESKYNNQWEIYDPSAGVKSIEKWQWMVHFESYSSLDAFKGFAETLPSAICEAFKAFLDAQKVWSEPIEKTPSNWQSFLAQIHPDATEISFEGAHESMRNEFYEWRKGA